MPYAENTKVSIASSKAEIEMILDKFGCDMILHGLNRQLGIGMVSFEYEDRSYRFEIRMPKLEDFMTTESGRRRDKKVAEKERDKAGRSNWRILKVYIQSSLEMIRIGNSPIGEVFMPYMLISGDITMYQGFEPEIKELVAGNLMPSIKALMPGSK